MENSGKCLTIADSSTASGARIIQSTCYGTTSQPWKRTSVGDYRRISARHSGKCLDVDHSSTLNGAAVIQYTCHDTDNQLFSID